MPEQVLIQHCAPTLAGLKTGNLFTFRFANRAAMMRAVRHYNARLFSRGVRILPLRFKNGVGLLYVYRPKLLEKDLADQDVQCLLREHGYQSSNCTHCIREIIRRLQTDAGFPHEIGLFLSYPPKDVRGFIEKKAGNCKACGFWKVYGDVDDARSVFTKFERCSRQYKRAWENGFGLETLAVKL